MKKIISVTILLLVLSLTAAEVKNVTSVGFGETPEKALDNALREGLAKVVGMYMSSSTFVKNYQTINDEITSFSNGYIQDYKVVSTKKDEGGLVEVNVDMSVKTGILITKLKELNIATIGVTIDKENVKKDLKMQKITNVNQEKLAEEYYKQIIEPIKLNKSHFIKINNFSAYEITDVVGGVVSMKNINTGEISEFKTHADLRDQNNKYDFMDEYYVMKVNYQFGITDDYYNNCVSFMDAAFKKQEGNTKASELEGRDKIIVTKVTSLMKTGIPDNIYKLDGRTLSRIDKFLRKDRNKQSYSLNYKFTAFDKAGFPNMNFKYDRWFGKENNIMGFDVVSDPRNLNIPYSKFGLIKAAHSNASYRFNTKENLCKGILVTNHRGDLERSTYISGGNLYFFKEDYGLTFNVYLAVPKTKITEIVEIKAELTTK